MHERALGESSFWAPYIALLPSQFHPLPLYLSSDEVSALQDTPTTGQTAIVVIKRFDAALDLLSRDVFPKQSAEFWTSPEMVASGLVNPSEAFRWAFSAVQSRAWGGTTPTAPSIFLVPFLHLRFGTRCTSPKPSPFCLQFVSGGLRCFRTNPLQRRCHGVAPTIGCGRSSPGRRPYR